MKRQRRGFGFSLLLFLVVFLLAQGKSTQVMASEVNLQYRTYIESQGWSPYSSDGMSMGSQGKALRLEALELKVLNHEGLGIKYAVHIQNIGWQDYREDGQMAGTLNLNKRIEAMKIELTGTEADQFDIYYRAHVQNFGWLDWAKNGHAVGSEEYAYRLEAVEIKIVKKGAAAPGKTANPFENFYGSHLVHYDTHIRNLGWVDSVSDGVTSGTGDSGLRLEAMRITLSDELPSGSIEYSTHVSNIGWMDYVKDGALSGTEGESRRLEAIKIKLTGPVAKSYGVTYRTFVKGKGWTVWNKDGEVSGTEGEARRLEAMEVKLYAKESSSVPEVPEIDPEEPVDPDPEIPVDPEPEEPEVPNPTPEKVLDYQVYKISSNLWLRETPMGTQKFVMAKGTLVKVFDITAGWAKLEIDGTVGYASSTYMEYMYDVFKEPMPMVIEINGVKNTYKNEPISATGISLAYSGILELKVLLDDQVVSVERFEDPNASTKYPAYPKQSLAGFKFNINQDQVSPGAHKITVLGKSNYGQSFSKTVEFNMEKSPPKLTLKGLSSGDPMPTKDIKITGLALNDAGVKVVNYYVNGTLAGTAEINLPSDGSLYPEYASRNLSGYAFTLRPSLLNRPANTLKVELLGKDGSKEEQSIIITGESPDHYVFEDFSKSFKSYVDKEYINSTNYVGSGIEIWNKVRTNMEPGNFIYDEVNKYLFMDLSYNVNDYVVSVDVLNTMLVGKGVLEGKGQTYLDAAIKYKVNPFYLVAHSLLESGNGTSKLATGQKVDKVYKTLGDINSPTTPVPEEDLDKLSYNVYGIGAYNSNALLWGSQYAYKSKWFSVEEAIAGGAQWIGVNYVHRSTGAQNTLYKMRFNLAGNMTHQYATDIEWAIKQASRIKKQFDAMGVKAPKTFYIPRFNG